MAWANTGAVPEQNWLYTIIRPGMRVDDRGIHPEPNRSAMVGNAFYHPVYTMPYAHRRTAFLWWREEPELYRFPVAMAAALNLQFGNDDRPPTLFSKHAFIIPSKVVQRRTVSGWSPM